MSSTESNPRSRPSSRVRPRTRWLLAGLVVGVAASVGGRAEAQVSSPVTLSYRASSSCPSSEVFVERVRARRPGIRVAAPGDDASLDVAVHVSRSATGHRGEIAIGGRSRAVEGASCGDVVTALALVAALLLDGGDDDRTDRPARSTSPSAASPSTSASASASVSGPVSGPPSPRTSPVAPAPLDERGAVDEREGRDRSAAVVVHGEVVALGAPRFAARGVVSLRLRVGSGFLAVGGGYTRADAAPVPDRAEASLVTGGFEACPWRLRLARRLSLLPCTTIDAGILTLHGAGVPLATARSRGWVAPGGAAWLEVDLTAWAFVALRVGVAAPLVRDTFYVRPDEDVFRASALVASGGLAAGARFP